MCARGHESAWESLPVLPLPSAVLFPGIVLPLHVFEACSQKMVEDALANDGPIGASLIRPGQAKAARPMLHEVAGAGRIIHADKLADGRYNILLQGVHRVRLVEEVASEQPYRCFRAGVIPPPDDAALSAARAELAKLQSCVLSLRSSVAKTDKQLVEVLCATSDPLELADILAATLIPDPERQQVLLATTVLRQRLATLIDALADTMVRVGEPPKAAQMN